MTDFYKQFETPLDKAVQSAIDEENQRYLESAEGKAAIQEHTENVRRWAEENKERGDMPKGDTVYELRLAHRGQYADRLRDIRNQLRSVQEMIEGLHRIPDDTEGLTVAELGGIDTEVKFGQRFLEVGVAIKDVETAWRELPGRGQ